MQKTDTKKGENKTVKRFLTLPQNIDTAIRRVAAQIGRENDRSGFLENFVKTRGFAVWDKALIKTTKNKQRSTSANQDYEVLIPLVIKDSQVVYSALACKVTADSVYIQLLDARLYKQKAGSSSKGLKGRKLSLALMMLNKEVFGHELFEVKDSAAFEGLGSKVKFVRLAKTSTRPYKAGRMVPYTVQICYTIMVPSNDGQLVGCPPCSPYVETTRCDSYSGFYDDENYGGGTPTPPGTPGGGGGGGSYTDPPLNPCDPGAVPRAAQARLLPCEGGTGWVPVPLRDANGFLYSRIEELENILQSDPTALVNCGELAKMESFGPMWQRVAQFTPSQTIINRIEALEQATTYDLTDDFYMQTLQNATGSIVNCDFFAVRIQQLPPGMTADYLLEYFRKNINTFITTPLTTRFNPYKDGVSIDETQLWKSPFESSLGSLVSIKLNLIEKGSVVLSDYYRNFNVGQQKHRFKFSTIRTPFDWNHPVSGNREFGIYNPPNAPGELCFYIMGVDRTTNPLYALANLDIFNNQVFSNADKLWQNIQENIAKYITDNGGQASATSYSNGTITARPKWNDVNRYLLGEITFITLKQLLGC